MASGFETVGRYVLLKPLGRGGMAEVFLAQQRSTAGVRKLVALKRILPDFTRSEQFVAMFLDEARLAARLNHPNVVQVVDFGREAGSFYFAMEYLRGEPLSALLKLASRQGKRVPEAVSLAIIMQVCSGLDYAHQLSANGRLLNLVHRDVTPTNVFVTWDGAVKLIDFGIARAETRHQDATAAGTFKGKFAYASPEQLRGDRVDLRADVFAVGVMLYELLSGSRLFARDSEAATISAVLEGKVPELPGLRPALREVVLRAVAPDPVDRFPSARALRDALAPLVPAGPSLEQWLQALVGQRRIDQSAREVEVLEAQADQFGTSRAPPRPRSRRGLAAAVAAAVTVSGLVVAVGRPARPVPPPTPVLEVEVAAPPTPPASPVVAAFEATSPPAGAPDASAPTPPPQEAVGAPLNPPPAEPARAPDKVQRRPPSRPQVRTDENPLTL